MPADRAAVTSATPTQKPRRNHRKARKRFDGRNALGRRARELGRALAERLGSAAAADPIVASAVERAAEMQALAEALRGRMLRGDPAVTANDVVRVTGCADRAVRGLFDKRRSRVAGLPATFSLADLQAEEPAP